jgi:hypothetical protein
MLQDNIPNLPDLIGFCLSASWLQIQDLSNSLASKNAVVSANPLLKTEILQDVAQFIEADIRVRGAPQNSVEGFPGRCHSTTLT